MHSINVRKSRGQHVHMSAPAVYADTRIATTKRTKIQACVQNWFELHTAATARPLFFHGKIHVGTSGIQQVVPTFHRAYNKQSDVYIKF